MPGSRSLVLLLLCFFLSGAVALAYETAWTREFAFVFGTSEVAVAMVLAAYMGGLALGAAGAARAVSRIRRPVLVYGLLELGIAVSALVVPHAIAGSRTLYVLLFGGRETLGETGGGLESSLFFAGASLLILLVPTSMMGATLPILARHAIREDRQIGSRVGLLYGVNTAGAVAGALSTAFLWLPALGLRSTLFLAAGLNAIIFALAWALSRSSDVAWPLAEPRSRKPGLRPARGRWILPLMLVSGAVSFGYEILWVRLLSHLLGSSIQAFATMLGSFLTGIALGSSLAARFASSRERAGIGFVWAQIGTAGLSWLAFQAADRLPDLAPGLAARGVSSDAIPVLSCLVLLLPAATCIGATFPFAVRLMASDAVAAAETSARVYTWNTVGSILGSTGAAFLLLPMLGFSGTLVVWVGVGLLLALLGALGAGVRARLPLALAAAMAIALVLRPPANPWNMLTLTSLGPARDLTKNEIHYFGVGRSATVLLRDMQLFWQLRTNGLTEASMAKPGVWANSFPVTRWLTALPTLARPEARKMLVIGLGGGTALEVVPATIERIDVIELEPEVIAANRSLSGRRWRDPLEDPRVHLHVNDARNALLLQDPDRRRFDAIVSQPSHPWAGGAAHLYTQEFFELAASRLAPEGVFLQWIGTGFVDEALLASLLAALSNAFSHVEVYQPPPGAALLFLCSQEPLDVGTHAERALHRSPDAFALLGLHEPGEVLSMLRLDEEGVRKIARDAPPNRDRHNRLQTRSERLGGAALSRRTQWLDAFDPLPRVVEVREDGDFVLRQLVPFRSTRLRNLSETLANPRDRAFAAALADLASHKPRSAERTLRRLLIDSPRDVEVRAALLRISRSALMRGTAPSDILPTALDETESLLLSAWQARSPDEVRRLDAALASLDRRHPLFDEALRQRILWRLEEGSELRLREAEALAEASLGPSPDASTLLVRARVHVALAAHSTALDAIMHAGRRLDWSDPAVGAHVTEASRLLRVVPESPELAPLRTAAAEALARSGVGS